MPTLENPGYFDRSKGWAASRADDFVRSYSPDYYVDDTGSVESPFGHLALVYITREDIAEYVTREGDPWMSEARNFHPGWYIFKTDNNGIVWALDYGGEGTFSEEGARADFAEAVEAYGRWLDIVDPDDDVEHETDFGQVVDDFANLPRGHRSVIIECIAEAWRNVEQNDRLTEADIAADIVRRLTGAYGL